MDGVKDSTWTGALSAPTLLSYLALTWSMSEHETKERETGENGKSIFSTYEHYWQVSKYSNHRMSHSNSMIKEG